MRVFMIIFALLSVLLHISGCDSEVRNTINDEDSDLIDSTDFDIPYGGDDEFDRDSEGDTDQPDGDAEDGDTDSPDSDEDSCDSDNSDGDLSDGDEGEGSEDDAENLESDGDSGESEVTESEDTEADSDILESEGDEDVDIDANLLRASHGLRFGGVDTLSSASYILKIGSLDALSGPLMSSEHYILSPAPASGQEN